MSNLNVRYSILCVFALNFTFIIRYFSFERTTKLFFMQFLEFQKLCHIWKSCTPVPYPIKMLVFFLLMNLIFDKICSWNKCLFFFSFLSLDQQLPGFKPVPITKKERQFLLKSARWQKTFVTIQFCTFCFRLLF